MKPIIRTVLLLGMLWLGYQTSLRYAFSFDEGYPLYPVIVLGICFSTYVRLRPPGAPRPVVYTTRDIDPLMIFVLAVVSCAFLLDHRGEKPFTMTWFLHMSVLTYFALLLPFIAGYASGKRAKRIVAMLTALILAAMFWVGTEMQQQRRNSMHDTSSLIQHLPRPAAGISVGWAAN